MTAGLRTIIYPVKDITAAKARFAALLHTEPVMDEPYYVQFEVGDLQVGLNPHGHKQGMTGPVCYWLTDDIKASVADLVQAGGEIGDNVRDVGGGKLIATVADPDGNIVGLTQQP